ncbi:MAG: formylmethanofuran dehydrogenase subunit A [Planctomycetaceae bacterium]|nr:formylmethanofuran dehydrogenase subunit A [Planctomycetaceae bacterium]
MSRTQVVRGATVFDPLHGVNGKVTDIWIKNGRIIAPLESSGQVEVVDAHGLVAMPGGIDMHCHIAGSKVNAARSLRCDDRALAEPIRSRFDRGEFFSGTMGSVPSTFAAAYKYAAMGYTAAFDAAVSPLLARQAHRELDDFPGLDKGFFTLVGNHVALLRAVADRNERQVQRILAWLLSSSAGYAPKVVNPGGVENWKQTGVDVRSLDQRIGFFDTTPRQVLQAIASAANELRLPHPLHIHTNHLGMPGNWRTTLESMRSLAGLSAHFAHIQFHSYGGGEADEDTFCSQVAPLADYLNEHPELSVDVGQVMFGDTTSMTGDGPVGYYLSRLYGRPWVSNDTELETGCGIVPIEYRKKSVIHAWQWAIGLEWFLSVRNPWQVVMSTDHPNGGSFQAYPQIIRLLMDREYRREMLAELPEAVRQKTCLRDHQREYSMQEIAIITRAAPAKLLGLANKGHLGLGADADLTLYDPVKDVQQMFAMPKHVLKAGEFMIRDFELVRMPAGKTYAVRPLGEDQTEPELERWMQRYYTIRPAHFRVAKHEIQDLCVVNTPALH